VAPRAREREKHLNLSSLSNSQELSSVKERRQNQVFFPLSRAPGQVSRDLLGLSLLCLWFERQKGLHNDFCR